MKVELSLDEIALLEIACEELLAVYDKKITKQPNKANAQFFSSRIRRLTPVKSRLTELLKGIV